MAIDISINLGMALLIIGMFAAVVAIYYINYLERRNNPERRPSMMTRTIIISLVIIAILLTIIFISGKQPEKWHYIGMVGIVIIVFMSQYYESERTKIKRPQEVMSVTWDYIADVFHAKPDYTRYGYTWPKYKVTEIPGGRIFDLIANLFVKTDIGFVLVQVNPYDLNIVGHEWDPDPQEIEKIFGENIARKYDEERMELIRRLEDSRHESKEEKTL